MSFYEEFAGEMEAQLSDNARKILRDRYLHGDSIAQWLSRICRTIAGESNITEMHEFARAISQFEFIPNTPCLANAGRPMGQLAACFVLPISDDLCGSTDSIFTTLRNAAAIQQTGGGVGFDWSALRPAGDMVASSGGVSSGPISFLRIYDAAFDGIRQGGMRRGACMAILRVDHPDIEAFIDCKRGEGAITNFNISVAITDEFMSAVVNDRKFALRNPRTPDIISREIDARKLMHKIAEGAWRNGEPGVVFIDAVNRANPVPNLYKIVATNPCGEQALGPYENCALGHINLARAFTCAPSGAKCVEWNYIERVARIGVRFLDNLVSRNTYVPLVPALREAALKARRIGLGITGLADLFLELNITYGSDESTILARQIMMFIRIVALDESLNLAKKFGPFPAIEDSIWGKSKVADTLGQIREKIESELDTVTDETYRAQITQIWHTFGMQVCEHGIRNACILTVAPTGTTSVILGTLGYGCEPVFSHKYRRTLGDGSTMDFCSAIVERKIHEIYASENQTIQEQFCALCSEREMIDAAMNGKLAPILARVNHAYTATPEFRALSAINATALNISAGDHLRIQAALQRWVDNGISKTINCPNETTIDEVADMYLTACKMGIKGVAIYRSASRVAEVLTVATQQSTPPVVKPRVSEITIARPATLPGFTYKVNTSFGRVHTTVNFFNGAPFEVFINASKSGTEVYADSEAIGRLISTILRMENNGERIADSANKRIAEIIKQLRGIGGSRAVRDPHSKCSISSLPDAIAVSIESICASYLASMEGVPSVAAQHQKEDAIANSCGADDSRDICPMCHTANLMHIEHCKRCTNCEYSAC